MLLSFNYEYVSPASLDVPPTDEEMQCYPLISR